MVGKFFINKYYEFEYEAPIDPLQLVEVCVGVVQQGVHHGGNVACWGIILLAHHEGLGGRNRTFVSLPGRKWTVSRDCDR